MLLLLLSAILLRNHQTLALFGGDLPPGSECSVCPPGYGVTRPCDRSVGLDTECQRCPDDTFNAKCTSVESCQPCTVCQSGYFVWSPCSRFRDAVCLPCSVSGMAPSFDNDDYRLRCLAGDTTTAIQIKTTPDEVAVTTGSIATSPPPEVSIAPSSMTSRELYEDDFPDYSLDPYLMTGDYNNSGTLFLYPELLSSSFNWIPVVAVLGGAFLFFLIGGLLAVYYKKKEHERDTSRVKCPGGREDIKVSNNGDETNCLQSKQDQIGVYLKAPYLSRVINSETKPLTGSPAIKTIDSPVNMPRLRPPLFSTSRKPLPPTPPTGTPVTSRRAQTKKRSDPERTTPLLATERPNLGQRRAEENVPSAREWSPSSPTARTRAGVFDRSLPYIDDDSKDEIVLRTGRPPTIGYTDPRDRAAARRTRLLSRTLSSLFRRLSGRLTGRKASTSRDVSREADDGYLDDLTFDTSFDPQNESAIGTDCHNTTLASSDLYTPDVSKYHDISHVDV